jgi:hypothetical protein
MEERGWEEERAAQRRTRPGRPGVDAAAPGPRGTATAAGEGRASAGARNAGATAARVGERGAAGEGKRRGRGAVAGEGEGRVRGPLRGRENEEHEETLGTTMEVLTGKEDSRQSREEIRRLPEIRRSNRRTERAATKPSTRRTQRYHRIRQTMHGLGVIARRSCRRSWNRPELRRAIPGAMYWIWRKRFVFWNGLDEMKPDMYIYLGFG